ncbi:MAG: site-2 protease family protein [Clostridia bacterium]|nr:site-2 protease family protein [Clostridia bacterium]
MKLGEAVGFLAVFVTMMSISSSPHPVILILCYLIHEAGHLFFVKLTGARVRRMSIGGFKLCLHYDCSMISYKKELLVCAGGIIFNLVSALLFIALPVKDSESASFFVLCNFSLALMNLYPVSTLDGGGILKCIFKSIFEEAKAEKLCKRVSFFFVFIMWLCAVYLQLIFNSNISFLFISVFLLIELCFS